MSVSGSPVRWNSAVNQNYDWDTITTRYADGSFALRISEKTKTLRSGVLYF